jgi:hypothetical protein
MPTAEAHVRTDRPSRYLVQLCRHTHQMGRMRHRPPARDGGSQRPPRVQYVDYSETSGTVCFAEGQLTLRATADTLTLRIEAPDKDTLQRLQRGIAGRLEKIGRRDQLTVTWQPSTAPPGEHTTNPAHTSHSWNRRWRSRFARIALVVGAVLVIAVHLGLGGAALAASAWTGWATNVLLAIIALKLIVVAGHVVLGRVVIRRGKIAHTRWKLRHPPSDQAAEPGERS